MDLNTLSFFSVLEDIRIISTSIGMVRSGVSSGWVWVLQLEDWRLVGNGRAAEVSPCVLTC